MEKSNVLIINESHPFFEELACMNNTPWKLWTKEGKRLFDEKLNNHFDEYKNAILSLPADLSEVYWHVYRKSLDFFDEKLREERKLDKYRNLLLSGYLWMTHRKIDWSPYLIKYGPKFQCVIPTFKLSDEEQIMKDNLVDDEYFKLNKKRSLRASTHVLYFTLLKSNENLPSIYNNDDTALAKLVGSILNVTTVKDIENIRSYLADLRSAEIKKIVLPSKKTIDLLKSLSF